MVTKAALDAAKAAYDIEAACITQMKDYFDEEQFAKAVELLSSAPRIGAAGSGHSGILCQHFAHLMCCIERPARFISPAEAVHGATGFLQSGDVMVFASRGGKTKELLPIVDICKAKGVKIITVTENMESPLAAAAGSPPVPPRFCGGACAGGGRTSAGRWRPPGALLAHRGHDGKHRHPRHAP